MDLKIRMVGNFFWLVIENTDYWKLFGKYELFELFEDGSESLLDTLEDCCKAIERGNILGIELGRSFRFKSKVLDVNNVLEKFGKVLFSGTVDKNWIEIKSIKDLPKEESYDFIVIDKENKKEYNYHFLFGMEDYWIKNFSHYIKK